MNQRNGLLCLTDTAAITALSVRRRPACWIWAAVLLWLAPAVMAGETTCASVDPTGAQANGRLVTFESFATNLVSELE
ncbi:MAG: hypothetical protein V2A76_07435 [Planctomycetota bacterium]